MKITAFLVSLLASSASAFFLSPTCLSTYKKVNAHVDDYVKEIQARICDQGCALTYQSYHEAIKEQHARPAVKKIVDRYVPRGDKTQGDIDKLFEMGDTVAELALQECPKLAHSTKVTPRAIEGSAPGDGDLCEDPSFLDGCSAKLKSKIPSMMWKHSAYLMSLSDNETCRRVSAAADDPEFWTFLEGVMDEYAQSCPTRA